MIQRQRLGLALFMLSMQVMLIMGFRQRMDGAEYGTWETYSNVAFLIIGLLMFVIDERKKG